MKKVIKNNYKIIIGILIGIVLSITTVYAVEAYIESNKVSYDNHDKKITAKDNVQDAIDELYERSGIHKEKWIDPILNGADPVLKDPLIPVEIKNNGEVYYANENSEWYNYSEKRWANAVILIDNPSNKNYEVGMQIQESDIESYFVWIPRYQYKIWDLGNYNNAYTLNELTNSNDTLNENTALWRINGSKKIIDIKFGNVSTIPKMSEPNTIGAYYTHPAFTFGNKNLNGIWVGKFETGDSSNGIIVKPDVYSWRNENVKTFFNAAKEYEKELNSHMMKNTEWGAVAYLSHSAYGIGTEINLNNNSEYKTGYSASNSDSLLWNTTIGYSASTTGNITGIYDMSGGAYEYLAACTDAIPKYSTFTETELANEMAAGYIDKYPNDSNTTTYNKRILGDATGELGPFYIYSDLNGLDDFHSSYLGNYARFVNDYYSWVVRGGYWNNKGVVAGIYYFGRDTGGAITSNSFRLVAFS